MKLAIAGKGGSGKTTIAASLARLLARKGRDVLALDGDSSPNLGISLGVPREVARSAPAVPREILEERQDLEGNRRLVLAVPADEVRARYGVRAPDGVTLLTMARVSHAGAG